MRNILGWISAANAGVALASFLAVRGIDRTMDEVRRVPETVGDVPSVIAAVTQWPLIAAWIAVGVSVVALLLPRRRATAEGHSAAPWFAAAGIAVAAASVLAFRAVADYMAYAAWPGRIVHLPLLVARITPASAVTGLCFAAAVIAAVLAFRARAAMRMHVAAWLIVISLGVSATLVVTLRDLHVRYDDYAHGRRDLSRSSRGSPRATRAGTCTSACRAR